MPIITLLDKTYNCVLSMRNTSNRKKKNFKDGLIKKLKARLSKCTRKNLVGALTLKTIVKNKIKICKHTNITKGDIIFMSKWYKDLDKKNVCDAKSFFKNNVYGYLVDDKIVVNNTYNESVCINTIVHEINHYLNKDDYTSSSDPYKIFEIEYRAHLAEYMFEHNVTEIKKFDAKNLKKYVLEIYFKPDMIKTLNVDLIPDIPSGVIFNN